MSRRADAHAGLLRHLQARLARAGLAAELQASHSERWASATFTGARHRFHFAAAGLAESVDARIARVAAELGEHDLPLPDHIVADIALLPHSTEPDGMRFEVEALTVEAR